MTHPATTAPPNAPDGRRRIFEVGTTNDHAVDAVDYGTKNRVLSKILQNTTTRSNVFFVWIQVDFFQALDVSPPNGVVRIGGKLATSPAYRGLLRHRSFPGARPDESTIFARGRSNDRQICVLVQSII